jgi:predicted dehydrogenase
MSTRRVLLIGAGGFASIWIDRFLPVFADRLHVTGLVDVNTEALARAGDALGMSDSQRFTEMEEGFARTAADCCIIVVQPFLRWRAVNLAVSRGLPIIAEKPIADSWETSLEILHLTRAAGIKTVIVQNYPYTNRIRTLKGVLDKGSLGRTNYIAGRFAADFTIDSAGGAFRHQVPYAMLFEGAVHHFDQFRNLAGADAALISGHQWNPPWSTFGNPPTAVFQIEMANGVVCQFELNHLARGAQNGWHHECYRVECEHGVVTVGADDIVRVSEHLGDGRLKVTDVAPVRAEREGHLAVIDEFLRWLDGGPAPMTAIDDNIYTAALTFAAVEAVRTKQTIDVAAMITAAELPPVAPRFANTAEPLEVLATKPKSRRSKPPQER